MAKLIWARAADGGEHDSLSVGAGGTRYAVRKISGRSGGYVLRMNGALVQRFESSKAAKAAANELESTNTNG